jgi:perosamine synthetase
MVNSHQATIKFIQGLYQSEKFIPLHEPKFFGNEKKYLLECIDSTYVSSVGKFVDKFESMICEFTGARYAIATVNGTAALHTALKLVGVDSGDEVITQPLSFIATCNAINYCNARPIFVDVDLDSMGMSPGSLRTFLRLSTCQDSGKCFNSVTGKKIAAVVPMHTFGLPCQIEEIAEICREFNIPLVEDSAESLGSYFKGRHTGTFGKVGVFSFNGNKTVTTGGGGMLITNDPDLAERAKHITTTAKKAHPYEFMHDEVGYNYRLPNINAALGCAQMESLPLQLKSKRETAHEYENFFSNIGCQFVKEISGGHSNYWLNAIVLKDRIQRDLYLKHLNDAGVMSRPIWRLMNSLEMFSSCQAENLSNAIWLEDRVVNIPSSARLS